MRPFSRKMYRMYDETFISILFLREESSRQRYLDSFLQDNSGDVQYYIVSTWNPTLHTSHITESTKMPKARSVTRFFGTIF